MLISRRVDLSIIVVAYGMTRELPRTLTSLSRRYQRDVEGIRYEIIVVDNGSPEPVVLPTGLEPAPRLVRLDPAPPSPAFAANEGVRLARGKFISLILDGARMVTPGAVAESLEAASRNPMSAVTTPAWHLGHEHQSVSILDGYDEAAEDELLAAIDWESDGYRLFEIAALAGSNPGGMIDPPNESCYLTVSRELWNSVGGIDERFDVPGGGYASIDLWTRLVSTGGTPIVILGEGSFHQIHRGASTKPEVDPTPWLAQYEAIRGKPYSRPVYQPLFTGTLRAPALRWVTV